MNESTRLIVVLSAVCLISAFFVAIADDLTKDAIKKSREKQLNDSILEVLPEQPAEASNISSNAIVMKGPDGATVTNSYWKTDVGYAIPVTVHNGYAGDIKLMRGFAGDNFWSYKVLKHSETPGLGANITGSFIENVKQRPIFSTNWEVKKDDGDIFPITAATISSRAVCDAIKQGIKILEAIEMERDRQ